MTGTSASPTVAAPAPERPAQAFWRRYFAVYDTLNEAIPYRAMIERQTALLAPAPGDRILDAGTGTGNMAVELLARGAHVVGIDFCEPALERSRAKAPHGDFRFGDLTRTLPFPDGHFDKVSCSAVLHVLEGNQQAFAVHELARVLKPGGRLVLTAFVTGFRALTVYRAAIAAKHQREGLVPTVAFATRYLVNTVRILYYVHRIEREERRGGYRFFTAESLSTLLTAAGLVVERTEPTLADQCVLAAAVKPPGAPPAR